MNKKSQDDAFTSHTPAAFEWKPMHLGLDFRGNDLEPSNVHTLT
jgi:hypothetical protein